MSPGYQKQGERCEPCNHQQNLITMRIIKKSKTEAVSSALNILGLTAAFAALYIILVQVHHDLSFNKSLKDSDRIYVLTKKEINQSE